MEQPIESIDYKGHRIQIHYDIDGPNPRIEFDNITHMICFHNRYNLGDKHDFKTIQDFTYYLKIRNNQKQTWSFPLYLYDHSGLTISMKPFSCQWDSGQIGWIYIEKSDECQTEKQAIIFCESEVKEYDAFLRGEVYGYDIPSIGESCWGFIGDMKYVIDEAKSIVDWYVKQEEEAELFVQNNFAL